MARARPWLMRTYAGHSSAEASNALFRTNLAKGQTGLSIAFDLPTQLGLDPDDPRARGEVGRVGVPVASIADMETLFEGIPLERMNTSMTINATAPWLYALYVALAERRGCDVAALRGTTQNDLLKEFLARGTYVFDPETSLRLQRDLIVYAAERTPRWNPINVCSYHLQEAGATIVEELAFALANAIAVLDAVREQVREPARLAHVVGRVSFFLNAGMRFVDEACKVRAFTRLWDEITRERYGVDDPRQRRFRYGVQVNSLDLSARQPELNVARIVCEALGVLLPGRERARALQLPAWNEALGLPRPWDQQWSLRIQQVLAYETDLLEHDDILAGSPVIERRTAQLVEAAREELARIEALGGAVAATASGYLKSRLVASQAARVRALATGERKKVGENCFTETEPSPLTGGLEPAVLQVDPAAEQAVVARLEEHRGRRDTAAVHAALEALRQAARRGESILDASIRCAHAGVSTGEWTAALREVFGDYRAPTGVDGVRLGAVTTRRFETLHARARELAQRAGRPLRLLVAKPGLDGHSNAAEQIAVLGRELGLEVIYAGIRLAPAEIARAAADEDVDAVAVSILSGAHMTAVPELLAALSSAGARAAVVTGGTIPPADAQALLARGVARVHTARDGDLLDAFAAILDAIASQIDPDSVPLAKRGQP
ncbi:MAG: protein meaA [Planctomycetota bacterium]|nr:MAG: protein meaA [Planctomycetota bacterium]